MDWAPLPPEWTGDPTQDAGALMDSQDGSVLVRQTFAGSDAPSGTWTLTIARLVGYDGEGATTRLEGPWVFTVQIP